MDSIQAVTSAEAPEEATVVVSDGQEAPISDEQEVQAPDEPEVEVSDEPEVEVSDEPEVEVSDELEVEVSDEPEVEVSDEPETMAEVKQEAPVTEEQDLVVEDEASTPVEPEPQAPAEDSGEMGGMPVEEWDYQRPKRGEVRTGVILSIGEQEIIVDVGVKRDGIVPYSDLQRLDPKELAELSVGDEVLVYVMRPEDQDGNLVVSLNMARQERAWRRAQEMANSGEVWEGTVIGYNKGGLVIPVDEIRGFVPASQVPGFPQGLSQEERLQRLADMVSETLKVKVIEINRRKRRLILSATTAQRQWRKQQRERLLNELREGEVRKGRVSSLCSFGAFVDLGGADGLVHLSELSWRRVRHPREAVQVGQEVEVYVLRLDHEKKRIGLSLKRLQPEPWALVEDKYELGQLVEGTVTNVVDFGAFAEIEEGVEGLIHVSELADGQVSHPKDVVKKDDLLLLRIIRIDTRRKRLGLSLKRVLESEWAEWAARLAVEEAEKAAAAEAAMPEEMPAPVVAKDVEAEEVTQEVKVAEELVAAVEEDVEKEEDLVEEFAAVVEEDLEKEEKLNEELIAAIEEGSEAQQELAEELAVVAEEDLEKEKALVGELVAVVEKDLEAEEELVEELTAAVDDEPATEEEVAEASAEVELDESDESQETPEPGLPEAELAEDAETEA